MHPCDALRKFYLDRFRAGVENARGKLDQVTTELLLELPSLEHPEYCYRLYRVDIIGKQAGESRILEVNVKQRKPAPWRAIFPRVVRVDAPLVWNGIEFRITGPGAPEQELIAWALRWLDVAYDRYDESAQFQEVVHSVSPPKAVRRGYEMSVDFGSAPTAAFDELLDILVGGASRVSIGSFAYVDSSARPQ